MQAIKNYELFSILWYNFKENASVLCVEEGSTVFSSFLKTKGMSVESATIRQSAGKEFTNRHAGSYDYIIAVEILEKCFTPEIVLEKWNYLLKDSGMLILATQNRFGIRYLSGDRDPFTGGPFDSVENYLHVPNSSPKALGGKLYAYYEIKNMLGKTNYINLKVYSVYPSIRTPQIICSEGYLPNENLNVRVIPYYEDNEAIFLDEVQIYNSLVKNDLFHRLSNAYIFECSKNGAFSDVNYVTTPIYRDKESFITIIHENMVVEKKLLELNGYEKIRRMSSIYLELKNRGVKLVESEFTDSAIKMPYVKAKTGLEYLMELAKQDKEEFISKLDYFRSLLIKSSESSNESDNIVLKKCYFDLNPINSFYVNDDFVFFDQEFCYESVPLNVLVVRMVDFVYDAYPGLNSIISKKFFYERYNIKDSADLYAKYIIPFMDVLHNVDENNDYFKKHRPRYDINDYNKFSIRYHRFADKENMLSTCFDNLENKKIFLFGAGNYCKKFLSFYKDDYSISGIIDSNKKKQGTTFFDFQIVSLDVLSGLPVDDYKVIICARNYQQMWAQLRMCGVINIGLYDANYIYPGRQALVPSLIAANKNRPAKKYHIGYIAGVFDLYHLGHLNMFRRAKEQCDYLIVGVTSDRYVRELKKTEPFIPFEERLELVRSCKYVDEAHEIPFEYGGTVEAFQKYHFDVQFSGSDYVNHPWWLEQQKWLREHGSDLVFFPYTEQTSSTKIKALIEKGLL